jgi:predicted secreted protein
MRLRLSPTLIVCGVTLLLAARSATADIDTAKLQQEMVDTWIVVVAGDAKTRSLRITNAEPKSDNSLSLNATYGWTATGAQAPVKASLTALSSGYRLELVTDANSLIIAEGTDLKRFVGTFKPVKGEIRNVTISRSASELVVDTGSDAAGRFTVKGGDRWTWNVEDRSDLQRGCSPGSPKGAQEIETVIAITEDGYATEIVGPNPGSRLERWNLRDGSYPAVLDGKEIRSGPVTFPLVPGNTWETTLVRGSIVTTLRCRAGTPERLKLATDALEVTPVSCEGRWKNLRSGNSDLAEYKYWFSRAIGRSIRRTASTWLSGSSCADIEYLLESYTRSGVPSR